MKPRFIGAGPDTPMWGLALVHGPKVFLSQPREGTERPWRSEPATGFSRGRRLLRWGWLGGELAMRVQVSTDLRQYGSDGPYQARVSSQARALG
jgi:hypothetical protein